MKDRDRQYRDTIALYTMSGEKAPYTSKPPRTIYFASQPHCVPKLQRCMQREEDVRLSCEHQVS
jgi:hypothetical protein